MNPLQRMLDELRSGPRALAMLEGLLTIVLVLLAAAVAARVIPSLVRRTLRPRGDRLLDETRARTLQPLLESVLRYVTYFIAVVMVLRAVGVDATAVLASAGVVGLAVGFGAQHLIRDVISGFFILAEGLIQVGDVITVGEHTGQVERIGIRATQVRKYSGELWTIPNGQISVFGNMSRDYMRAIVDVPVPAGEDIERTAAVTKQIVEAWANEQPGIVKASPEVLPIHTIGSSEPVTLRVAVKVTPTARPSTERELRQRLRQALEHESSPGA